MIKNFIASIILCFGLASIAYSPTVTADELSTEEYTNYVISYIDEYINSTLLIYTTNYKPPSPVGIYSDDWSSERDDLKSLNSDRGNDLGQGVSGESSDDAGLNFGF